jgi:hypothetical protein
MTGDNGQGLRGGTFTIDEGDTLTVHLDGAKLSDDVTVNGSATVDQTTGKVEADIDITSGDVSGTLAVSWDAAAAEAMAVARGTLGGRPVSVTLAAP